MADVKGGHINLLVRKLGDELEKLNGKIDDWNDPNWRVEQVNKLKAKREVLEDLLRGAVGECNTFGVPVEQLSLPLGDDDDEDEDQLGGHKVTYSVNGQPMPSARAAVKKLVDLDKKRAAR